MLLGVPDSRVKLMRNNFAGLVMNDLLAITNANRTLKRTYLFLFFSYSNCQGGFVLRLGRCGGKTLII